MSQQFSVRDEASWGSALDEAVNAVQRGALIVLPTDTVYGIGADAFSPNAVTMLLAAKGRGRQMPPPVLLASLSTLDALASDVPAGARTLAEKFWPGALTIIFHAQPSLAWDLGETHGTVALRMPDHPATLALLGRTGPLAVSSANSTGNPAATTIEEAQQQLGESVSLYLDAGVSPGGVASTIIEATGAYLRVVRDGAISLAELRAVVPGVLGLGELPPPVGVSEPGAAEPGAANPADPPRAEDAAE